jgi:hypothetical protein
MKITHIVEGSRPQKPKPYNSNPVAKNIDKFNKPATHRDRKNDYKRKPKFGNKDFAMDENAALAEGPLVLSRPSDVLRMLDTLLNGWKSKQHSDEEMAQLLKALGYKMDKKGDRTVLVQEDDLDEAPGAIRKGIAAVALIAGLWGVNNHLAQQAYDASPQLQKLTAYLEVAQEHNDQRMIDQLEQRIENHKARLDIGKGDVMGKDGRAIDVKYDKDMDESTDFRKDDRVKDARTGEKGTVLHKGNRDEVVVKFGSLNKSLPASQLRLVDEGEKGTVLKSRETRQKILNKG